ncbi:tetratricopeptide repeat protein [Alicyclobacillus acidoterrestris]|uniref:Helix-turn-helix transcriptional regulator n=1 Tax=Alicyclobacillus acidoterrestris (strain ATCC 49025 / DSM 3922 / CIP 106132 / NCIMB 13137 / GD3B) TaxID=1356854 RepID=T0DH71_ALIAG|nr:tetratricopeptide repeat protein [Alicyclobacillus acidoterrestris]EPZ48911.1 hypothetical protein N007_03485 [Alicyclobacillus acidoterrestris ATCC 49025]UNO47446.1 helix-turn-helix transcriptional regulator [Alicyclobacillus acidoterrestris]
MDTLGKKIRTLRRRQKLTQQALADGIVTASMISQIESDRATPSAALLQHIAGRLNVDLSYFESDLLDKSDELQNYRAARSFIERGFYEDAIKLLKTLSWPLSPQFKAEVVYNEMANCYLHLGQLEEACAMYESVIQIGYEKNDISITVHGYYHIGTVLRRLKRDRVARMYWQRAAELLQQNPDIQMPVSVKIHANLARIYLDEGNWQRARQAYEQTLQLANRFGGSFDTAKIYQGLSCALMQVGEFDLALAYNDSAITINGAADNRKGAMRCRINRGIILRVAGRHEEALAYMLSLRDTVSDKEDLMMVAILHELALIYWDLKDFDSLLTVSDMALRRNHVDQHIEAQLRLLRAKVYLHNGSIEFTQREIERGRRLIPSQQPSSLWYEFQDVKRQCWLLSGREQDVLTECIAEAEKVISEDKTPKNRNISA